MLDVAAEAVHKLVDDVHRATVLNYDSLVLEGDAESFLATNDAGPEDTLLDRETQGVPHRRGRSAARAAAPRRRRLLLRRALDAGDRRRARRHRVADLAAARGSDGAALEDGINSQLDPDALEPEARPNGRVARRKAAYFEAVAAKSDPRSRLRDAATPAIGMVSVGKS